MDDGQEFRCHKGIRPLALVTPDAVPPAAQRLRIQGRLNGRVMQDARTALLIRSVPELIETISVAMSLEPGDVSSPEHPLALRRAVIRHDSMSNQVAASAAANYCGLRL